MNRINLDLLKRPMIYGTIIGVLVLALVWWLAWWSPEGNKLSNAQSQEVSLQQQVTSLDGQIAVLRAESSQVAKELPYLAIFNQALPSLPNQGNLTTELYVLSRQTKTFISDLNDSTIVPTTGYSTMPISMTLTGSHNAVLAFLKGIYGLPRLVTIQAVTLSPPGAAPNLNTQSNTTGFSATISGTAYTTYLPPAPNAA